MKDDRTWRKLWAIWTATAVGSGVVLDTAAYVYAGHQCTLTANIRRWTQLEPRGKYARLGLSGLVGFFGWCIIHLGFGLADPLPRAWSPLIKRDSPTC